MVFGGEWAPKTRVNYLGDVRTMFNWAVRRAYLDRNPAAGVELPVLDATSTIAVHTSDQVRQVLETARRCALFRRPPIRGSTSVERETDLKLEQSLIEVPAVKSKTRARRLVKI